MGEGRENVWPTLSRPLESPALRVISMGLGVDTTGLALMAARGEIGPMPDCAIFADTGGEPSRVYRHIEWLRDRLPFPLTVVSRDGPALGDFQAATAAGLPLKGRPTVPLFLDRPYGMMAKQCSKEWKTRVVQREIARMLGLSPGQRGPSTPVVEQWIGMDRDDLMRVRSSEKKWIHNRHPLVELDMRRRDVVRWLQERQYPYRLKSSCVFCPFRDDEAWSDMREYEPDDFKMACQFDERFRSGYAGMEGEAFVHWTRVPLQEADFTRRKPKDGGLFGMSECEARCGA